MPQIAATAREIEIAGNRRKASLLGLTVVRPAASNAKGLRLCSWKVFSVVWRGGMRLYCVLEDSAILGRIRAFAGHFSRLILAGAFLAGGLYGQPPAAAQMSFLNGNACDSPGETNFLSTQGAVVSRSLWASPFSSFQEQSSVACHPSLAAELSQDSSVSIESHLGSGTPPPLGLGGARAWAWSQQSPAAATKKKSPSATSGSPGHIFWVVPAFHVDYAGHFTPLTPREKFDEWAQGAYDPLGLGAGAVEAATLEHSSKDGFCGYGQGWNGYGKCFGSLELDANISGFIGDFALPVLLHQDPRYFRLGEGSFGKRAWYAVSRVFVTYNDSGRTVFYSSALSGTVIAAGLSNLYYPQQDRGFGLTLSRIAIDLGNTALYNLAAEFWPDIKHDLYRTF